MRYRLEWISSFVAVVDEGGFSAAAVALQRSQPRVSTHIADLEKALRLRLFDRSAHPVALTPEGNALLPHARAALSQFNALATAAGHVRQGLDGEVSLGVHREAAPFLVPRILRQLREYRPTLRVRLHEMSCHALDDGLLGGGLDLAVRPVAGAPDDDRLAHRELWHETPVAVLPGGTATTATPLLVTALADRPLIVLVDPDAPPDGGAGEDGGAKAGSPPDAPAVFQTSQPQTLVSMVRHGWGTGLARPLSLCSTDLDGVDVVQVRLPDPHSAPDVTRHAATAPALAHHELTARDARVALWWRSDHLSFPARHAVGTCVRMAAAPALHYIRERCPTAATALLPTGS